MKHSISPKTLARALLPNPIYARLAAALKQLYVLRVLARDYGQYDSMKLNMSVGKNRQPIPWYTYPATEFLNCLEFGAMSVFEYGSGNSSRWWLERCSRLVAVESDKAWFELVRTSVTSPRFQCIFADEADYAGTIRTFQTSFDVIVVDGVKRADCALAAIQHVQRYGGKLLILDNSDWYPSLVPHIRDTLGWVQVDFHGFGPISRFTSTTSMFVNPQHSASLYGAKNLASVARMPVVANDDLRLDPHP